MSHARVEELSDSDPDIDDPSDFLPQSDNQILRPNTTAQPSNSSSSSSSGSKPSPATTSDTPNPTLFRPPPPQSQQQTRETIKTFQCLYPIYFDSTRTKAQGRRVGSKLAVPNPLAYNVIMAARATLGNTALQFAFEPDKTHPKDWANPGRVRVQLFDKETRQPLHPQIKNKAHLYRVIGQWLKENPTSKEDPLELRIQGLPVPDNFGKEEIPKPRGWKMGSILPVHSPAVSGGGVRDDFFKEAMEEMRQAQSAGGQLPPGMPGGPGGGMPDMSALQNMMSSMGGLGGMGGGMPGLGGGGDSTGGKKKKDKKKG
ncbi:signal recognition particle subunit [Rhinocladiella similis]